MTNRIIMTDMQDIIKGNFQQIREVLDKFVNDPSNFKKIEDAAALMIEALKNNGKILSVGNGGSICDAMHFCEELTARFRGNRRALPAIAPADPSFLTCCGNDFGFDNVFSRFVEAYGIKGDVLLGISTSGNSENVVRASIEAKQLGMTVVTLAGKPDGKLVQYSDIYISTPPTGHSDRSQEIHTEIIHTLVQLIENGLGLSEE